MKLLIADDESIIRKGLLSLDWKSIGITDVFSVSNGEEAKELLLSTPIDIGIFDIRMPGLNGLELADLVQEKSLDMAVVLLTGFSEFEYAQKAIRTGVYNYLLKPINPGELLNIITDVKNTLENNRYKNKIVKKYEKEQGSFDTVLQVKNMFSKVSSNVMEILIVMAKEFSQPISLTELSERYYFSNSYMSKKIKQETGYSFVEILNAIRLMNAVVFLQEGDKINQACEKSGFNDQRYFSQVFRKAFGCSPSDYKKQEKRESDIRFYVVLENVARS